jgi:probable phosphoglycerate mutase
MSRTELLIARHAEARCNVEGIVGGRRGCAGLTDLGRRQAGRLGLALEKEHRQRRFATMFVSPLRRARETADIVANCLAPAPPLVVVDDLRDPDFGDADGRPWRDALSTVTGSPEAGLRQAIARGAETWITYRRRSASVLAELITDHAGKRILVIAHGELITSTYFHFLQLPDDCRVQVGFETSDAAITRWRREPLTPARRDGRWLWHLVVHNDTSHLQ